MIMNITQEPDNRSGSRSQRFISLFLTACFFLGAVALAMHHHDFSFQLRSCDICKAKASFLRTLNNVNADLPVAIESVSHSSEEIYFTFYRITYHHQTPFISSLLPDPLLNKAPPFIS
jgi:hypothetical protein